MRPGDYIIRAGVGDSELEKTGRASVDCNSSTTHIGIRKDGSVDSTEFSTAMACAGEMGTTVTEEPWVETQEATHQETSRAITNGTVTTATNICDDTIQFGALSS